MSVENAKEFLFEWEIPNFSFDFYKNEDAIDSPVFEVDRFGGSQWYVKLFPCGESEDWEGYISCYLYKKKNDIHSEKSSITFDLELTVGGKCLGKERLSNCVYKVNEGHGWEDFLELSEVPNEANTLPGSVLIVRCHLFNIFKQSRSPDLNVRTENSVNKILFLWNIKTSDVLSQLASKDLVFAGKSLYEIFLSMPDDTIKIRISQKEKSTLPMLVACKLSLVNSKGERLKSKNSSHLFEANDKSDVWEFPTFIAKADLDSERNTFSLFCEIVGSNGIKPATNIAAAKSNHTVLEDLKSMLHNHIHSDIKLKAENVVLQAHKSILAARSPVFSAMFNQDMVESNTGVVDIPDLESNVLKLFLDFLYTDTIEDLDYEKARKLFVVADKYQVSSLIEKCATFLECNLSLENVTEILSVADMIGHERLKKVVMNFVAANSVIIFNTPEWQDLIGENVKLAVEMISVIASNFKIVPDN